MNATDPLLADLRPVKGQQGPRQIDGENWSILPVRLMRLEERIVLDAAGLADPPAGDSPGAPHHADHPMPGTDAAGGGGSDGLHSNAAHGVDGGNGPPEEGVCPSSHDPPQRVLAVSSVVEQSETLAGAAGSEVHAAVFDGGATLPGLLQQIRDALHGHNAESIALATHGLPGGGFELVAGHPVNLESLHNPEMQAFWKGLAEMLSPGGRIDLLACKAGAGPDGQALIGALEDLSGVNFAASVNLTGNLSQGGDWILETDHVSAGQVYFDPHRLNDFTALLAPPTITDTNPGHTAVGHSGPVVIDSGITVTDGGNGNLMGAVVRIKGGFVATEDRLAFDEDLAASHSISGSYNLTTGELTLSGDAPADAYQAVLRTVTYENTSDTPNTTPREMLFVVGVDFDGYKYFAQTGHYYEVVTPPGLGVLWADARTGAAGRTLEGLQGYLATVTSANENNLIFGLIPPFPANRQAWLGANDAVQEGHWYWVTGPEAGTQFWEGGAGGSPVGGMYARWEAGYPNVGTSSALTMVQAVGARWRDAADGDAKDYYVVEYGGLGSDTEGQIAAGVLVNVVAPNHAPVLDPSGSMRLSAIDEDAIHNPGSTVASVIASAGGDRITDYNPGALEGIALTHIDNAHGTWQYSLDHGQTWNDIGTVTEKQALLLRDVDLIRFRPDPNWNGTLTGAITFRAWDQTSGAAGGHADVGINGGDTAFSTATEIASLEVHSVNDAPVLDNGGHMSLSSIDEDTLGGNGNTIASIIASAGGNRITDPDAGALEGIALFAVDHAHGAWEYSVDGGLSWHSVGAVSSSHALLLRSGDLIRFQPDPDWNGTLASALSFRAWDQTTGSAGGYMDATAHGGTTALSSATETASLLVQAVNDSPTIHHPLPDQIANEDSPFSYRFGSHAFADVDGDALSYWATLANGRPLPNWLVFDPATRTFHGTPGNGDVGTLNVKVTASDGHGGVAADVFGLTVVNVNDAPTVAHPLVDQVAHENSAFRHRFASDAFQDIDVGDTLAYHAVLANGSPLPAWLLFDPATRTFHGTPGGADVGKLSVRVTADDGHGGMASDVFTISVLKAPGVPPPPSTPANEPQDHPAGQPSIHPTAPGESVGPPRHATTGSGGPSRPSEVGPAHDWAGSAVDLTSDSGGGVDQNAGQTTEAETQGLGHGDAASATVEGGDVHRPAGAGNVEHGAAALTGHRSSEQAGAPGPGGTAGADQEGVVGHHRQDEELELGTGQLGLQITSAMLSGDLLSDGSQPVEFREAWDSILAAYADSGEELAAYLQSAFRAVTESALIYQAAERSVAAVDEELTLAAAAGTRVDVDVLVAEVVAAREEVRGASAELQAAILAAARAGKHDQFDRVLEDVIEGALQRLMAANEHLFLDSQALTAALGALREARAAGAETVDPDQLAVLADQGRVAAQAEVTEMRKSWDRVAQDVFSAFVARLVVQRFAPDRVPG
jgi:hypothetical protein